MSLTKSSVVINIVKVMDLYLVIVIVIVKHL